MAFDRKNSCFVCNKLNVFPFLISHLCDLIGFNRKAMDTSCTRNFADKMDSDGVTLLRKNMRRKPKFDSIDLYSDFLNLDYVFSRYSARLVLRATALEAGENEGS